jgi:uncharacterized damage-inducible protein DinB
MNKNDVQTLIEYNEWANSRILQATSLVTAEQFTAPARLSFGSLRGTLVHILATETIWRLRVLEGISPTSLLSESEFPTFDALRQRWIAEGSKLLACLTPLDDPDMVKTVHYTNTRGIPFDTVLWQILAHVVNHGTQFRSEAGVALTEYGSSPGDIDLIKFLRERVY